MNLVSGADEEVDPLGASAPQEVPPSPARRFAIVCDSTAELPVSLYRDLDVQMVPLHVEYEGHDWRDGIDISPDAYLDVLARCDELPKSSQPAPAEWLSTYKGLVEQGWHDIISLHLPGAVSGTVDTARACADEVMESHPNVRIKVIDTYTATIGEGVCVIECALMRDEGATLDEAVAHVEEMRRTHKFFFIPDTLDNLVKGGRLSKLAGLAASMLDIKPVIETTDVCGMIVPAKTRGMRRALERTSDMLLRRASEVGPLAFFRLDAHAKAQTRELLESLVVEPLVRAGSTCLGTVTIGPVIATHIGLGATGIYSLARRFCSDRLPDVLGRYLSDVPSSLAATER